MKTENDVWLEYNDSYIRQFDFKKLESECFGGSSDNSEEKNILMKAWDSNIKNAYMLIYERRLKTPIKMVLTKQEKEKLTIQPTLECENTAPARIELDKIYKDSKKDEFYKYVPFYSFKRGLPEKLMNFVWEDNNNFLFERQIYSVEFFRFVQEIIKDTYSLLPTMKEEEQQNVAKALTWIPAKMIFEVLSHAYQNNAIKPLSESLINIFAKSPASAEQFAEYVLSKDMSKTMELLRKCPDKDVRNAVYELVAAVIVACLPGKDSDITQQIEGGKPNGPKRFKYVSARLINALLIHINKDLAENWPRFEQFFDILRYLIKTGNPHIINFFQISKILILLIDFYLGSNSPLCPKGEKRASMGNKFQSPNFEPLIDIVCTMLSYYDLTSLSAKVLDKKKEESKEEKKIEAAPEGEKFKLSEDEIHCLTFPGFISKTISEGYATESFGIIIKHLAFENEKMSKMMAKFVLKTINDEPGQSLGPIFCVIESLFNITDSLQRIRIEWLLGIGCLKYTISQNSASSPLKDILKVGLELDEHTQTQVTEYVSALTYKKQNAESLLAMLWRIRKRYDIQPIKFFLKMMAKNKAVYDHVMELPAPSYQYAKYIDWIKTFLANYPNKSRTTYVWGYITLAKERDDASYAEAQAYMNTVMEMYSKGPHLEPTDFQKKNNILTAYPQPFLIGKFKDEKVLMAEEKQGVAIEISELFSEVYESAPTGKLNLGSPKQFLNQHKEKFKAAHSNYFLRLHIFNVVS